MANHRVLSKAKVSMLLTVITAFLSSLSISLIPFAVSFEGDEKNVIMYVVAALFWAGLISMLVTAHITKRVLSKSREKAIQNGYINERQPIGIINFSKGWKRLILYTLIVIGMLIIIYDIGFGYVSESVMFPVISATFLSFTIHCVIDGRYYKVYKLIKGSVEK